MQKMKQLRKKIYVQQFQFVQISSILFNGRFATFILYRYVFKFVYVRITSLCIYILQVQTEKSSEIEKHSAHNIIARVVFIQQPF